MNTGVINAESLLLMMTLIKEQFITWLHLIVNTPMKHGKHFVKNVTRNQPMKIKDLEIILREYNPDTEIKFGCITTAHTEYDLKLENTRHHPDSDTLLIEFLVT